MQTPGPAPDFATHAVVNGQIGHVGLKDYQGEKYVVLVFYPMDFVYAESITPFCKRVDDFKKLNCAVLAMSTDSVYSHKAFVKASKYVLTFILPIRNDKTVNEIKSQESPI